MSGGKAVPSLAKKPDPSRTGSQKLKFVPTLPARRQKSDVKQEETAAPLSSPSTSTPQGGDRGRGRGRGRGEGRGPAPRPPPAEMTASGPFAMGPSLAGAGGRRSAPRSNFAPTPFGGPSDKLGSGLTQSSAPSLKREKEVNDLKGGPQDDDDAEVYSEPDEGVQIVDMDEVRNMDWMAPEALLRDTTEDKKRKKKAAKIKQEDASAAAARDMAVDESSEAIEDVNLANAVDLSESEEEEELEDIIDDFSAGVQQEDDTDVRQERLYFFQFPTPFPTFKPNPTPPPVTDKGKGKEVESPKKVSFADEQPSASAPKDPPPPEKIKDDSALDGVIGQMEIYRSGAVKLRLANEILMDVAAATQPSFLQHVVYLDRKEKRLCVLGEINRRFVVTPDIESLLAEMELPNDPEAGDSNVMDTT